MQPSSTPDEPDDFVDQGRKSHAQARLAYLVGVILLAIGSGQKRFHSLLPAKPTKVGKSPGEHKRKTRGGPSSP